MLARMDGITQFEGQSDRTLNRTSDKRSIKHLADHLAQRSFSPWIFSLLDWLTVLVIPFPWLGGEVAVCVEYWTTISLKGIRGSFSRRWWVSHREMHAFACAYTYKISQSRSKGPFVDLPLFWYSLLSCRPHGNPQQKPLERVWTASPRSLQLQSEEGGGARRCFLAVFCCWCSFDSKCSALQLPSRGAFGGCHLPGKESPPPCPLCSSFPDA